MLKSFSEERPGFRVKAVDVDPRQNADAIAACLLDELELEGGRQEVGYPEGMRTIFETVAEPLPAARTSLMPCCTTWLFSRPGGLKGVTAELLRELALPGNTLLVTGRSPLNRDDPGELKQFISPDALRDHFVAEVRRGIVKLSPGGNQKKGEIGACRQRDAE